MLSYRVVTSHGLGHGQLPGQLARTCYHCMSDRVNTLYLPDCHSDSQPTHDERKGDVIFIRTDKHARQVTGLNSAASSAQCSFKQNCQQHGVN